MGKSSPDIFIACLLTTDLYNRSVRTIKTKVLIDQESPSKRLGEIYHCTIWVAHESEITAQRKTCQGVGQHNCVRNSKRKTCTSTEHVIPLSVIMLAWQCDSSGLCHRHSNVSPLTHVCSHTNPPTFLPIAINSLCVL